MAGDLPIEDQLNEENGCRLMEIGSSRLVKVLITKQIFQEYINIRD